MDRLIRSIPQVGRLSWIGCSPERRAAVEPRDRVELQVGTGLEGDHHARSGKGSRQVTLVQAEHLPVIATLLGRDQVDPGELRRNLVVSGINLWALRKLRFRVGDVLLEGTGPCPPCSRMEEIFGAGGYHAVRGHGGICARVLEGGEVRLGDAVRLDEVSGSSAG